MTINKINNKKYIGKHKSDNVKDDYMGSGIVLRRAINKYGVENFEKTIIEIAYSNDDLNEKEKHWITFYDCVNSNDFYNIADGGQGGNLVAGYSPEEYEEYMIRKTVAMQGINKGRKHSDETKLKLSEARKGKQVGKDNPMYGKGYLISGENNGMYGKKHSKETLQKIRENSKGFDTVKYEVIKPNEESIIFNSRQELFDYMFNTYECSEPMIKKLINKGAYTTIRKKFSKMNGIIIKSINKQEHKQ